MSADLDANVDSDQGQDDNHVDHEDVGGLFGSGSEDEGSRYGAYLDHDPWGLTFPLARKALATSAANLMMRNWTLEMMKVDWIESEMMLMKPGRKGRCTNTMQIFWTPLLDAILAHSLVMVKYGFTEVYALS